MKLEDIIKTVDVQRQILELGSKLAYSYEKKNKKSYEKLVGKEGGYYDKLSDKKLELALIDDKTGAIIYSDRGDMLFDRVGTKALNDYNKQLLKSEEEFEFYKITYSLLTSIEKEKIVDIDEEEYEIISRFIENVPFKK